MGTRTPTPQQQQTLDELEAERDQLNAAITALRKLWGLPVEDEGAPTPRGAAQGKRPLRADEFFGMSIIQAAKRYLSLTGEPQSATDIAKAIRANGLQNTSKGFPNTVYSMLYRDSEKPKGTIVKVGDKWGLKDFYEGRSLPQRQKRGGVRAPSENGAAGDDEAPE